MSPSKIKNLDLRRALRGIADAEIIIPILHTELNDPEFTGFSVNIEPWTARPPDGYFHPSTHATWGLEDLYHYLAHPELLKVERMELTSVFAITQGNFWHLFLQHVLKKQGILVEDELGFSDEVYRRRGHMDGLLSNNEGLEIKTMNARTLSKINTAEDLKELKPGYWAQAQEYLDVFQLGAMRFLILNAEYPFTMKEFVVRSDEVHQIRRRKLYAEVIELVEAEKR